MKIIFIDDINILYANVWFDTILYKIIHYNIVSYIVNYN